MIPLTFGLLFIHGGLLGESLAVEEHRLVVVLVLPSHVRGVQRWAGFSPGPTEQVPVCVCTVWRVPAIQLFLMQKLPHLFSSFFVPFFNMNYISSNVQ